MDQESLNQIGKILDQKLKENLGQRPSGDRMEQLRRFFNLLQQTSGHLHALEKRVKFLEKMNALAQRPNQNN